MVAVCKLDTLVCKMVLSMLAMPFTSDTARAAGAKGGYARARKRPVAPQVLVDKASRIMNDAMDGAPLKASQVQAASRVLGVLYDAGVKPTVRDDSLGEAMRELLAPTPASSPVAPDAIRIERERGGSAGANEAAKTEGASEKREP